MIIKILKFIKCKDSQRIDIKNVPLRFPGSFTDIHKKLFNSLPFYNLNFANLCEKSLRNSAGKTIYVIKTTIKTYLMSFYNKNVLLRKNT
ncbi:hypothetical protein GCM10011518_30290 [Flavobacterium limi]|uniref:Uncharacterized protein n=1 Tax=Flavobacterium limi TaxID=2045105 RepID=A0ABQ1UGX5_9FLAO|nr:hypothetical protein GCM10011518_30290 [Flavobacterium limi]